MAKSRLFKGEDGGEKTAKKSRLFSTGPVLDQSDLNLQSSRAQETFFGESQYDEGLTFGSNQQDLRAKNQPFSHELANGLVTGVANIIPSIIGNTAAILDFQDYSNKDNEVGNSISRAMSEWQKSNSLGLGTEDIPIYQPENSNMGDREWWMQNFMRDTMTSAGSFAITGMGVGTAVSALANISKLGKAGQLAATALTALTLNQAEGIQMATQVFDDAYDAKYAELIAREVPEDQAKQIASQTAADAAAYTININRLTIPLNLTSSLAFLKPMSAVQNTLKNAGKREILKDLFIEGGQEYIEENVGTVAENAGRKKGQDANYSLSVSDALKDVFSQQGLESGILGFLGGVAQTGATSGFKAIRGDYKQEREAYNKQQAYLDKVDQFSKATNVPSISSVFKSVKEQVELQNQIQQAAADNNEALEQELSHKLLHTQTLDAFENQSRDKLINFYKDLSSLKSDEAQAKGLDIDPESPSFYKSKAMEAISEIKEMEKFYNKILPYKNKEQIFKTEVSRVYNSKLAEKNRTELHKAEVQLAKDKANTNLSQDMGNENPETQKLESFKEVKKLTEEQNRLVETILRASDELNTLTSPKYQEALVKEEKKVKEKKAKVDKAMATGQEWDLEGEDKRVLNEFLTSEPMDMDDLVSQATSLPDDIQMHPRTQEKFQQEAVKIEEDQEFNEFVNTGFVSDEKLFSVADKIVSGEKLTDKETAILSGKTSEINDIIRDIKEVRDIKEEPVKSNEEEVTSNDDLPFVSLSNYISSAPQVKEEKIAQLIDEKESSKLKPQQMIEINQMETIVFAFEGKGGKSTIKDGKPIVNNNDVKYNQVVLNSKVKKGDTVYLSYASDRFGATIDVNTKDETGKLTPITKLARKGFENHFDNILDRVKSNNEIAVKVENIIVNTGYIKDGIEVEAKDLVTTEVQSSLSKITKSFLPDSKLIIGTVKDNVPVYSEKLDGLPAILNIPSGRSFFLLKHPRGHVFPVMGYEKPLGQIEINGEKILTTFKKELASFYETVVQSTDNMTEINNEFNRFTEKWKAQGVDIRRYKNKKPTYQVKWVKSDGAKILKLTTPEGVIEGSKGILNHLATRMFATDADRYNDPAYTQMLIDTDILTTNLYPELPFKDSQLVLDMTNAINTPVSEAAIVNPMKETITDKPLGSSFKRAKLDVSKIVSNNKYTSVSKGNLSINTEVNPIQENKENYDKNCNITK